MKIPVMQFFKKMILILTGLLVLIVMSVMGIAIALFYDPTILINPESLQYALTKTDVLEKWSWKSAKIEHKWVKWNQRKFFGGFEDLCLIYDNPSALIVTCLEKVFWSV